MRTAPFVPHEVKVEFPPEVPAAKRQERVPQAFFFHRADEAFDERDAAVLADSPEALPDAAMPAPLLEPVTPELRAFVRDEVL